MIFHMEIPSRRYQLLDNISDMGIGYKFQMRLVYRKCDAIVWCYFISTAWCIYVMHILLISRSGFLR